MSRVGKHPVIIPSGVEVKMTGKQVSAKGSLGTLFVNVVDEVEARIDGSQIIVAPRDKSQRARTMWGTVRNNLHNIVNGVSKGFSKDLELVGVGYRASMRGDTLVLQLGYSHDIEYAAPAGINIKCPSQTQIVISGADKQKVGQIASEIRSFRSPEPYKGKGVKYVGEKILRKEGKKK